MNKIINELTKSIDNIKQSINNKYTSQNEDAPIGDDTLLKDYASAIDNIPTETVDISQQIFVFYCWATNETDARSKTKPTITWNSSANKWSIECTLGGWSTSADEEELDPNQPNVEKYLYAWFVSVNTNSDNTGLPEPDPVRLTGKTGAKGEDGSDGRDGVIAGLTLRNIITLYCASNTEPEIRSISYEQGTDLSQLFPSNIKINDVSISSDPTSYTNQQWSQTYDINSDLPIKIWKIDILYSSKSEAMLLGNRPILITNTIDVEIKYGTSISPEISPDIWSDEYPANPNNTVWVQRKEKLSDHTVKTIEYPIGLRGPAGIQFIGSVESENDLSSISLDYDNNYIGKLGVRVGQDVYVWYGTEDPNLHGDSKIGDYWWLNIGTLSPIPDWNASEDEVGYIENRTHYSYNIVKIVSDNDNPTCDIPENTKSFIITDANNNVITDCAIIGNILHINSEFTFPYTVTFKIYEQLDPNFVPQMIEITYADLKNLRDTNQLIPGMQYRITDYVTTTVQENTKTAGHQFDIIVTADSTNILNEKAKAIQHEGDTYFANSNLAAWEIWYCLDNDEERFAWTSNDPNKLDEIFKVEYTDNNNVPHIATTSTKKRYVKEVLGYGTNIDEYQGGAGGGSELGPVIETYSPLEFEKTKLINDSKFYTYSGSTHFEYTIDSYIATNILYVGNSYHIVVDTSQSYELLLSPECEKTAANYTDESNKPVKWYNAYTCNYNGTITNKTISNIFVPDTYRDLLSSGKSFQILMYHGVKELDNYTLEKAYNVYDKKGVIYRMIDEWNNDCPYDFKNIQFKRWKLNKAHPAISNEYNTILLSTINKAFMSSDSYAFSYIWSGTNDGKKYWDWNQNIYSHTTGETNFFYTFSLVDDNDVITDNSLNRGTAEYADCYSNTIKKHDTLYKAILNNNIFLNHKVYNDLTYYCYFNKLGYKCCNNTFSSEAIFNHLGNACSNNIFGIRCSSNSFGDSCSNNVIYTSDTSFGNGCCYNIFRYGGFGNGNIFGNFAEKNIFVDNCQYNTFGNDCKYNYFGGLCEYNTFGNGCESVKNRSNKTTNSIFGNKCNVTLSGDTTFAFYINSKKVKITYE